ncbi:MAG: FAD-dependent oxidoreductase [SAR324 cluster bacterium]|nr:FAD-dependent oxidoreductase [SAR324 cluster bacterium]
MRSRRGLGAAGGNIQQLKTTAESMETYNLVVIGAGSGGLMVAAGAAGLGARVALVEKHKMGGDCLNYGCVPSKALLSRARHAAALPPASRPEWAGVSAQVQSVIDGIAPHDSVERFTSLGVDVLLGSGRLESPRRVGVELNGGGSRTLNARSVVIATGSAPARPTIPGLAEAGYITNEEVFSMPELPNRLLVLGAGAIGVELGQGLARLGAQVTLIELLPQLLPREDQDGARVVAAALERDGVRLLCGRRVLRVEKQGTAKRVIYREESPGGGEQAVEVDEVLVAVGRSLNVEGLGLEAAGVDYDSGGIKVNARMQTSARPVYACGDVVGRSLFTHTANQQARVIIQNALLPFKTRMDERVLPYCVFTDPELAAVGLNETAARERGIPYRLIKVPLAQIDRAACEGETEGFLKILTPPGKDAILGATLVCAHAGELIHELALAMQARLGLGRIAGMVHAYPTRAEIIRRAADEARKASFTPTLQRLFSAYLRWRRN